MISDPTLEAFERYMRTAQMSPKTIRERLSFLGRLVAFLAPVTLLEATPGQLEAFQQSYAHLSRNSVDIYTRHVLALYRWLVDTARLDTDPTVLVVRIRARKGIPHPISEPDLTTLLRRATGPLRLAYVLAAFAGLRAGEITRLRYEDFDLTDAEPTALIHGKGGRERRIPLLPPVAEALQDWPGSRRGVVLRLSSGRPYSPEALSIESCLFMQAVGVPSTLHSLRHYFATEVVRNTRDVLLTRDLLGHASLATTQIYMASTLVGAHGRLVKVSDTAARLARL